MTEMAALGVGKALITFAWIPMISKGFILMICK